MQGLNLADDVTNLKIYYKWGFDRTRHSDCKQAYDCDEPSDKYDNSFSFTLVPIRVINNAEIIFENLWKFHKMKNSL